METDTMHLKPLVSVIIPAYNDAGRLMLCLTALASQSYPPDQYEVIVVDNGSADRLKSVKRAFNDVLFLEEPRPGSYCARNTGIAASTGDILCFTDSDCIPEAGWIENGVSALLSCRECGLAAGRIKLYFKNADHPTSVEVYESIHAFDQKNMVENYHHGTTANLFTYRRVVQTVGPFNAELKSGGDVEWGKRVYAHGFRQVYAHDACVLHPARHKFQDIYQKTVRVAGGLRDMGARLPDTKAAAADMGRLFISLAGLARRCLLRLSPFDRIETFKSRLGYIAVFAFVRAAQIVELQRLRRGAGSQRA